MAGTPDYDDDDGAAAVADRGARTRPCTARSDDGVRRGRADGDGLDGDGGVRPPRPRPQPDDNRPPRPRPGGYAKSPWDPDSPDGAAAAAVAVRSACDVRGIGLARST